MKDDHEENPDIEVQPTEPQADADAAPEPAAAPAPPAKPPELTDDECQAIFERAGRDVVQVWSETITGPLVAAAKGVVVASSFGADAVNGVFNRELHFAHGVAGAEGWAQRVDYEVTMEDGRFRDCRRISDHIGCVRSALRLRDKLREFAALPVAMKSGLGGRRESAVEAARNVTMAQTMAAQAPHLDPAYRVTGYRARGITLVPTPDGEDIEIYGASHQQVIDEIKRDKIELLRALKAETKIIV